MKLFALLALLLPVVAFGASAPPLPPREFRAVWIATVHNIDWPSKAGLSSEAQRAELTAIMKRAAELKLNAVIFQVRPQCDAFYRSSEPWSRFLSGTMGENPGYDPLAFAIQEAHANGLELHAWFNPFRAASNRDMPLTNHHVTRTHPEWVRTYGTQLWLDPGEPDVREYSMAVIMDVVRRYDVDGIHIDDYFYPYPIKENGVTVRFPDEVTWGKYGGRKTRGDWRRSCVDNFVEHLYSNIKKEKRSVKVGISPFGIWRPGEPETIEADLDSYDHLYADARRWLYEGWCDYMAPQLYWPIEPAKQSFPVLLDWWRAQNRTQRHVWPGLAVDRIGGDRTADEIGKQIGLTRRGDVAPGQILWSGKHVFANRGGVADLLKRTLYTETALVPESRWLDSTPPERPVLAKSATKIEWQAQGDGAPRWWLVQTQNGVKWSNHLYPGTTVTIPIPDADVLAVRAVDRAGNLSEPAIHTLR